MVLRYINSLVPSCNEDVLTRVHNWAGDFLGFIPRVIFIPIKKREHNHSARPLAWLDCYLYPLALSRILMVREATRFSRRNNWHVHAGVSTKLEIKFLRRSGKGRRNQAPWHDAIVITMMGAGFSPSRYLRYYGEIGFSSSLGNRLMIFHNFLLLGKLPCR